MKRTALQKAVGAATSDKISSVSNPRAVHAVRNPSSRFRRRILALFNDGFTIGEISALLGHIDCSDVAVVVMETIRDEATPCA